MCLLLLCSSQAFSAPKKAGPEANPANVIIDGNFFPGVSVYTITDATKFFSIKEIAEIYNATLEWKPVSAMVTMHINNRKIDIKANSNIVIFGKDIKKMSLPSRLIKNELYISPEFLTSKNFADIANMETTWNPQTSILNISNNSNISAIRYFTRPESTQVVLHLTEPLPYVISKASGAIVLTVHRGQIQRDFIYANNGAVRDITYDTEGKSAVIKINLQQTPKLVKSVKLENPDRISIDISHSSEVDISALNENTIAEVEEEDYASLPDDIKDTLQAPPEEYGEAEITEVVSPIEAGENNKDLEKVPVVKFQDNTIIDDSYTIIDDTTSLAQVVPKDDPKKKPFKRKKIIVIDAGHGGEDPGAVGPNRTKEKDINLSITYELKKVLDDDDDYEVVLTRKDDTFIPLVERTNIANEHNADLFISIHCNANVNRNVSGFEVYFLSEKATDSEAAATATLENSVLELEGKPTKKRALLQEMLWSMMLNEYLNDSGELCSFIAAETPGRLKIPNRGVKQASL